MYGRLITCLFKEINMARPTKCRRVCCMPKTKMYGPVDCIRKGGEIIELTVDEFETIRLIDNKQFSQEECAKSMKVARTTVQKIYADARMKLADSVINGKTIIIGGGDFVFEPEKCSPKSSDGCCCK